jgi:predicted nucleotidyltransferase
MDLGHPEYSILGTNRARVLHRLFVLGEAASGRYIHELSGNAALQTTQRILDELVSIGMVRVRRVGAANAYRANRDHILWEPVEAILATRARLESSITAVLESVFGARLLGAMLYGSVARGDATAESDIDILAVWGDTVEDELQAIIVADASDRIARLSGNPAQIIAMTRSELEALVDADDPFVQSLRREGRRIAGAELSLAKGA